MANIGNFDARTVDPNTSQDPIPAGWYNCQMTESEVKPTKDNTGAYLECRFKVLDGQYAGRVVFDRLNLHNQNPTAVEIAYRTLSAICHATGVLQVQDSQALHGIPLQVKVSVQPPRDGYDANNQVKGYRSINEGQQANTPTAGFAPPQQAPQSNGNPFQASGAPSGSTPPFTPPAQQQPPQAQNNVFTPPQQNNQPAAAPAGNEDQSTPPWMRS